MKHTVKLLVFLLIANILTFMAFPGFAATSGEKNALRTANSYLSFMGFSYTGLISQLEVEGYTHSEAVYAADNCGADWNANALRTAKSYLSFMGFSYTRLIEQLEHDGYTHNEAVYAADVCFERVATQTSTPTPTTKPTPTPTATSVFFSGDFSQYSFQELKDLQSAMNKALWASNGWQKVTVPAGVYIVGEDIPAGHWTISETNDSYFRVYKSMKDGDLTGLMYYSDLNEPVNIKLYDGNYVEIRDYSIIFTPYTSGLGFIFTE